MIHRSTNKVYGNNANRIPIREKEEKYELLDREGVSGDFPIDLCIHTPHECSKLAGDLYVQNHARGNEANAAMFKMPCIYGAGQFGVEDRGWVAWFTLDALLGEPTTIYGDGKWVQDILHISDLVRAFDFFVEGKEELGLCVFNTGGRDDVPSLLELLGILEGK